MAVDYQFDASLLEVSLNSSAIKQKARHLQAIAKTYDDQSKIKDLLLAVNCIDLTTLGGDDTPSNVSRLCWRANHPLSGPIVDKLLKLGLAPGTTGSVCVNSLRVQDCRHSLDAFGSALPIATTVAGFPAGQGPDSSVLAEVKFVGVSGANEVDIVINRTHVLTGKWKQLYDEIRSVVLLCKQANLHLKVILSDGELATLDNVYKASMCAMMAGADFIKTSTGKESINAKLVFGLVMTRAITDFYFKTGLKVGLKPAGGLKDSFDALCWVTLVRTQLGGEWLNNKMFRIGASSMLANIEAELFKLTQGTKATAAQLSF